MDGPLPKAHVTHLANLIREDNLVLFVGAGISRQAPTLDGSSRQMPLWLELARMVALSFGERLDNYDGNILDLFDSIAASHSRGDLEEAVRRAIPQGDFQPSSAHFELAKVAWHTVLTTNYDNLLARALHERMPIDQDFQYEWMSRDLRDRPKLIHFHGSMANLHTLTGRDYADWPGHNRRGYSFLQNIALQKTILFAGYSFSDPHMKYGLLPWVQSATEGRGKRHFAWMWDINPKQVQLLDTRCITALPIVKDSDWEEAFSQLGEELTVKAPPGKPKRRPAPLSMTPSPAPADAIVNGYKLFFYRTQKQRTVRSISAETKVDARLLNNLEQIKTKVSAGPGCFGSLPRESLAAIEHALDCVGKLEYGQPDDFLATYLMYYKVNKVPVNKVSRSRHLDFRPDTKAVVFDFGGTLTRSSGRLSTWEKMWSAVGYTTIEAGHTIDAS